jgi:hypothetical protein
MTENLADLAEEMKRRGIPPRYLRAQMRRGMSPQEIFAAWPVARPKRIRSRGFRRRFVVVTYAVWIVIAATVALISASAPGRSSVLGISVLLLTNSILTFIWVGNRGYLRTPSLVDGELDERLVQIGNLAFRRAYQVLAPVALLAWPLSLMVLNLQPNDRGHTYAFVIYLGVALLATTLPTVIVAWREPDPVETDLRPA